MTSDQPEYMEQVSSNDEQSPNNENEENYTKLEDNKKDNVKSNEYHLSEHFHSVNNTSDTKNPGIIKIEENEPELQDSVNDADKVPFFMPEHFLSQTLTNTDSNEGVDVNYVVGASAETLYTLTHTHDTGRKRVKYSCNVCEKEFKDKRDCIRHVRVHTGEKPFKCFQCGESFGRECYLSRHIKCHTGEKPFSCPLCSKDFARKATLEQHLLTHTDMSLRPFPCNQCESGFTKRSHLERHLKIHAQIREFKCSMCDKDFLEKRGLIDHMKRLHSDRVLPSCEICNREFRWEHLLRRHMKAHTHNASIEASQELLWKTLPIFVSKDKIESQSNTQNSLIETSDSDSSLSNDDESSQNSDTVKSSSLDNSTNEELATLNPQFFQSSVNIIGKTDTSINNRNILYNGKEFNNLGRISEKPTTDSGMLSKEQLTLHKDVLQPAVKSTIENPTNNELSSLHPNFFQSSIQDIINTGPYDPAQRYNPVAQSFNGSPGSDILSKEQLSWNRHAYQPSVKNTIENATNNELSTLHPNFFQSSVQNIVNTGSQAPTQRNNPRTHHFNSSGMISKDQMSMYNNVLQSTDDSFGRLFPTWSQIPPKQ